MKCEHGLDNADRPCAQMGCSRGTTAECWVVANGAERTAFQRVDIGAPGESRWFVWHDVSKPLPKRLPPLNIPAAPLSGER